MRSRYGGQTRMRDHNGFECSSVYPELGMCRQVLKSDDFRFAFLCSFFSYPILFNDPFEVSRHPDSDRG